MDITMTIYKCGIGTVTGLAQIKRADKTHRITIGPDEAYIYNGDSNDFKKKYRTLPE
jgi:hypothetical protein